MRRFALALGVLVSGSSYAAAPAPAANLPTVDMTCPYGHHSVRRVPVLNGLIAIDKKLQQQVERFEIVLGGCTGSEVDAVICAKCGFKYYSDSRKWERVS